MIHGNSPWKSSSKTFPGDLVHLWWKCSSTISLLKMLQRFYRGHDTNPNKALSRGNHLNLPYILPSLIIAILVICVYWPLFDIQSICWNSSSHSWLPSLFPLVLTNTLGIPSMRNLCDQDLLRSRKNMEKLRTRRKLQQIFFRRKWTSLILKNPLMVDIPCRGLEKNTG